MLFLLAVSLLAQTTASTGSITGTVTDPSGAVVAGAKVTISNSATGQVITTTTLSTGAYASGALTPGDYRVRVEGQGFKTAEFPVSVTANTTSSGNVKLELGLAGQVVNTQQATVEGVLTAAQMENLPSNGRQFLDLAQLEPSVQTQDGGTFDPTKNGYSSVSFGGRFGRTARIEVDGVDISDETVGSTTQNLPLGAIQESSFQQSMLDLSTELTSSGSVNVTTRSGTNSLHGAGFYFFRDQSLNANLPAASKNPFQRNQFGGSLGGPIIKNKLFFFLDAEHTKQDLLDEVLPGGPFVGTAGNFNSPFRETEVLGKLDLQVSRYKVFYRFTYDQNKSVLPFIPNTFQPFTNVNHARSHAGGVDFSRGNFTHSLRLGYTKFENGITDAVIGSSIFNPAPGIQLAIGGDPNCLAPGVDVFCSGSNFLAPQATVQSNLQVKYDGSRDYKNHMVRFGAGYNNLHAGGFAEFLGLAAAVGSPNRLPPCIAQSNCPFAGGAANPLNYPAINVTMGNGQGFSSEKPAFGLAGGGLGPDHRFSAYVGDSWKIKPTFTLTLGLGYVRDTGRTNSDLGPIATLNRFDLSDQFYTYRGLGSRVRQPNLNLAPQVGFGWDPSGNGKTVVRAGAGLFYENSIWNNSLFDRPARLQTGLFLGSKPACTISGPQPLSFATTIDLSRVCGAPIGNVASQIATLQQEYQASVVAAGPAQNPSYIGTTLADGLNVNGTSLLAPAYVTPRSVQLNFGVQREIRRGTVLTIDFLRNVSTRNLLSEDTSHVGDFRYFNRINAAAAINATLASCGATTIDQAISAGTCPAGPGGTTGPHTARIYDFAANGLDSGYALCAGFSCPNAAFPGANTALGANQMLFPIGRSVYNGVQATLKQDINHPAQGIEHVNVQASYSYSKYVATARDNDFINYAFDNSNPTKYIGPNGLDRTHQISFGGYADLIAGFQLSLLSNIYSPLPSDVRLPVSGFAGGIFQTDVTGDGTGDGSFGSNGSLGDLLPGTNVGDFGRKFGTDGLNRRISAFNTTLVGQLTPAGQAVVNSGLITKSQMTQLLGTIMGGTPLQTAPFDAVGQTWLRTVDVGVNWSYKIKETVKIQPGVTIFNVFNLSNFDGPAIPFSSILDGSVGSPNGTTNAALHGVNGNPLRLGLGSGVNALGAPRALEFQLRLSF
jgi:hypothetical protein